MINGSEFVNNPIGTAFKPFTDLFQQIFGNGDIFYMLPIIGLTLAIYFKSDDPTITSVFMIGTGGLLGISTLTVGYTSLGIMFGVFAGIGIAILIVDLILQIKR
jgi:hypothetical protein